MSTLLIIVLAIAWWGIGFAGFVYWWTNEMDYTGKEVLMSICVGVLGPITWIIGAGIHGKPKDKVIFKRRN